VWKILKRFVFEWRRAFQYLFFQESETLANRLIEGQILNAQYAEESYQLKRENYSLKKQISDKDNPDIDQSVTSSDDIQNFHLIYEELETLRERVNRLNAVSNFHWISLSSFRY
jgi:hypothetical protein